MMPLLAASRAAIVGATLLAGGPEPSVVKDGIVVTQGGRIVAVGERAFVPLPKGAQLLDGRGLWVVAAREEDVRRAAEEAAGPVTLAELGRRLATAARAAGREPAVLAPGGQADLVLLEADPLADVHNLRRVRQSLKSGERP
jgi:imidazolonepropionase-like amidohydrolase